METKTNYALVGLFVLLFGSATIAVILWLTVGLEARQYDRYVVWMEDSVSGLSERGPVRYQGVEIGRVAKIGLDPQQPERIRLLLEIDAGTPIRADTRAVLSSQGVTGLANLELSGGTRQAEILPQRNQPPYPEIAAEPSLVTRLDRSFSGVVAQVAGVAARLELLLNQENLHHFASLLQNLERLSAELVGSSGEITTALRASARTFEHVAAASAGLESGIERIMISAEAVRAAADAVAEASVALEDEAAQTGAGLRRSTAQAALELELALYELRRFGATLERLADGLEHDPQQLIFGAPLRRPGPGE